jgi:hypothetical protein
MNGEVSNKEELFIGLRENKPMQKKIFPTPIFSNKPSGLLENKESFPSKKILEENISRISEIYTHQTSLFEIKKEFLDELATTQEGQLRPIDWNRMSQVEQERLVGLRSRVNSVLAESFSGRGVVTDEDSVIQLSHLLADSIAQACCTVDEKDFDKLGVRVKEEPLRSGAYNPTDSSLVFSTGLIDAAYREIAGEDKLSQLAPQSLGELIMVAGHEVYHLRQHRQNPAYMYRTLSANRVHEDRDAYDFDQGEMAATAFSLRFLVERRRRIEDDLSGVDEGLIKRSEDCAYEMHLYSLVYRSMRRKLGKDQLDEARERAFVKWIALTEKRKKERSTDDVETIDDLLGSIGEI